MTVYQTDMRSSEAWVVMNLNSDKLIIGEPLSRETYMPIKKRGWGRVTMFARVDQVHDYVWRGEGVRGISLVILLNELINWIF